MLQPPLKNLLIPGRPRLVSNFDRIPATSPSFFLPIKAELDFNQTEAPTGKSNSPIFSVSDIALEMHQHYLMITVYKTRALSRTRFEPEPKTDYVR